MAVNGGGAGALAPCRPPPARWGKFQMSRVGARFDVGSKKAGDFSPALRSNVTATAYEQPRLSPQLRHLKQAPLRTAMCPHLGHAGASCMKCFSASLRLSTL